MPSRIAFNLDDTAMDSLRAAAQSSFMTVPAIVKRAMVRDGLIPSATLSPSQAPSAPPRKPFADLTPEVQDLELTENLKDMDFS